MKTLLPFILVFFSIGISAQVEAPMSSASLIILKDGNSIHAKKLKNSKKWVKYKPDFKGCVLTRFIKREKVDTVIFNAETAVITKEARQIAFNASNIVSDSIHFLKNKNQKAFSLVKGQKAKFSTTTNKYKGVVQSIDGDEIGFSKKKNSKKMDSLTLISASDVMRYQIKINRRREFRKSEGENTTGKPIMVIGGKLFQLGGIIGTLLSAVAYGSISQLNGPGLGIFISTVSVSAYYIGFKAYNRNIIIGKKWTLVE